MQRLKIGAQMKDETPKAWPDVSGIPVLAGPSVSSSGVEHIIISGKKLRCAQAVIVSLDKRMKKLCVRSADATVGKLNGRSV